MAIHGLSLAIRLGFVLALVRFSSPVIVGLFGLATSVESVAVYLAGLEFHTFTARRLARRTSENRLRILMRAHRSVALMTVPLAGLLGVGAAMGMGLSSDPGALMALLAVLIFGALGQELSRYLVLARKPVHSVVLAFLRTAAWQPAALMVLSPDPRALRWMLVLWALASAVASAWGAWQLRHLLTCRVRPHRGYLLHGLYSARGYYAIASLSVVQGNIERFVLQLLLGPAAVGVFYFFQTLANTVSSLVQTSVVNVALPNLLTRFGQRTSDRHDYLSHLVKRSLLISFLVSVSVCIIVIPVTTLVSRQDYIANVWMLPALLLGQMALSGTQPIHLALYAAHYDRPLIVMMTAAVVASVLLDGALVSLMGISGAVLAAVLVALGIAAARQALRTKLSASDAL